MNKKKYLAFSLIELSIVVLIIGILIAGVTQGSRLVRQSRLATANSLTANSPVASINGLIVWLDTARPNSLQNANSEFEIQDQDKIQNWYSINPQINYPTVANQSTGGNQPTYVASGINGLPSIYFNSANSNYLSIPDSSIISPESGITMFVVVQLTTFVTASTIGIISKDTSSGVTNPPYFIQANSATNVVSGITSPANVNSTGGTLGSGITFQTNTPYVFCGTFDATRGHQFMTNVRSAIYTTATQATIFHSTAPLRIGEQKHGIMNRFLDGYISEIIMFDHALKSSEINDINHYLNQKYGITFA